MSYMYKGQDRRNLKKGVMSIEHIIARDVKALNPKKTSAISTRQLVFDVAGTNTKPQLGEAQAVLDVLKIKLALKTPMVPAVFSFTLGVGGALSGISGIVNPGSYPGLPDGTYYFTVYDSASGHDGEVLATLTGGVVSAPSVSSNGTGYGSPFVSMPQSMA